jgi:hypothetical protein
MKISPIIFAAIVLIFALTNALTFITQERNKNDIEVLTKQTLSLSEKVSGLETASSLTKNPLYTEFQNALIVTDLIGDEADRSKLVITKLKTEGKFAKVSIEPVAGYDMDASTGYLKQSETGWSFISIGTGGDMQDFYKKEGIPASLQEK